MGKQKWCRGHREPGVSTAKTLRPFMYTHTNEAASIQIWKPRLRHLDAGLLGSGLVRVDRRDYHTENS